MENEDLIKKLEKIEFPKIEIPSHKKRLKMALIDWKYNREPKPFLVGLRTILVPLSTVTAVLIIALIISNLITPQTTLADVRKIAMTNPKIKELTEKGAEIKDIEIIKDRAYVLISPKEISEEKKEEFNGALAEISLKEKEVLEIKEISSQITPLTPAEEEKIEQIIQGISSEIVEIEKIESIPAPASKLELIKKDSKVEISAEENTDKKAKIIYKSGGERIESEVNLSKEKIEKIKILEEK